MGLLSPPHVEAWRKGRIDYLEQVVQGNLEKISFSMYTFRRWAQAKGLRPSETRYVRAGRGGQVELRFSKSGDESVERQYRTHYVSPELAERKREKLEERLNRAPEPVVFLNLRPSRCMECAVEIPADGFLTMEGEHPLCLACAGFGDLEFLPAGDTALTRRAGKYSARRAVVVRFSRSRGRYERQGILAGPAAIERAEQECFEDADALGARPRPRRRAAPRAGPATDRAHDPTPARDLPPLPGTGSSCDRPAHRRTRQRPRGPFGGRAEPGRASPRSGGGGGGPAQATDYDRMLAQEVDRAEARARVAGRVQEWSARTL